MINQFHTKRLVMNGFVEKHKRLPNKQEWKIIQKCIIQAYQDLIVLYQNVEANCRMEMKNPQPKTIKICETHQRRMTFTELVEMEGKKEMRRRRYAKKVAASYGKLTCIN